MKKAHLITAIAAAVAVVAAAVTLIVLYRDKVSDFLARLAGRLKALCPMCGDKDLPEEYEDFADIDDFADEV